MSDIAPLRPFKVRLDRARREFGVANDAVLKDYALSYLLAGIQGVPQLDSALVFKGGTALRKCYFPSYRFSEDLDFTLIDNQVEERSRTLARN